MLDVMLISMPFAPPKIPNAGVGVLTTAAKRAGLSVRAAFPFIRLIKTIRPEVYTFVSEHYLPRQVVLADWLFAHPIHAQSAESIRVYCEAYQEELRRFMNVFATDGATILEIDIPALREQCLQFLEEETERILDLSPRIVGCSSTFFQRGASLALLKRIKALAPQTVTMLGGANCEAEMGYETARQFPWVDFVFSGEADDTFPRLCQRVLNAPLPLPLPEIPYGVYTAAKVAQQSPEPTCAEDYEVSMIRNMETVNIPDYGEYFADMEEAGLSDGNRVCAIEFARGCQKGERSLCTFCGLNGRRVCYRSKSTEQFIGELQSLQARYHSNVFVLTDNILGKEAFSGWLAEAARQKQWTFFLEVRSILNEKQVKQLGDAEVFNMQPGIENLHDRLLRLMNKGNSALRNIALMKYAKEQSIRISWNLLYNIPGEADEDYHELAELLPLLSHLSPPMRGPISYCKFSQYYNAPEQYGLRLRPMPGYRLSYPHLSEESLRRLAYEFVDEQQFEEMQRPLSAAKLRMIARLDEWKSAHTFSDTTDIAAIERSIPALTIKELHGMVSIRDYRPCAVSSHFLLDELESELYRQTRSPITLARIRAHIAAMPDLQAQAPDIETRLEELIRNRVMIRMGAEYLSLATYPRKPLSLLQRQGYAYDYRTIQKQQPPVRDDVVA